MANQIAIAGTVAGVAEAVAYAQRRINIMDTLATIGTGAAGSADEQQRPKMAAGDDAPGFYQTFKGQTALDEARARGQGCPR